MEAAANVLPTCACTGYHLWVSHAHACPLYTQPTTQGTRIDCVGFNNTSTLEGHLCRLSKKGRKEIEEIVEEMKEKDREERGTGMKVKKQKK